MQFDFSGKTALITGSARGIGRSIAERFADLGANLVINDVMEAEAQKTAAELTAKGVKAIGMKCDVSNSSDIAALVKKTVDTYGAVDILVNNAGITKDTLLMRMKEEDWDAVLNINLKGAFLATKECVKVMMKNKSGRIVNIASIVGIMGNAAQANYSASKGGLIALTKTTAREVATRNINVNAVAPGFIDTAMTRVLPDEVKESFIRNIPMGRFGSADDIADAVIFLCSPMSGYITGQVLSINGGMLMP